MKALATVVVAAFLFAFVGGRFRIPTIVMYLVAGLVIGPATGLVGGSASLGTVSAVGIVVTPPVVTIVAEWTRRRRRLGSGSMGRCGRGEG